VKAIKKKRADVFQEHHEVFKRGFSKRIKNGCHGYQQYINYLYFSEFL
jgi:hypothetical protein